VIYALHFKGLWHDPPTLEDVEEFDSIADARAAFAFRVEFEWMPSETSEMHLYKNKDCLGEPFLILYGDAAVDDRLVGESRRRHNTQVLREMQLRAAEALVKAHNVSDEDSRVLTLFLYRFYEKKSAHWTLAFDYEMISRIQSILEKYLK